MAWDQKEITAYLVDVETGDYLHFQYNPKPSGAWAAHHRGESKHESQKRSGVRGL